MLADLVQLIPPSVGNEPGGALYSGRAAFDHPSDLYIIDYHPGDSPAESPEPETVGQQIDRVLNREAAAWSAYVDDSWRGNLPGSRPQQRRLNHLFEQLGLNAQAVPAAPLIFRRWQHDEDADAPTTDEKQQLMAACWPFHQAVIDRIGVRVVVCLGSETGNRVRENLGAAREPVREFVENNQRQWRSYAYQAGNRYILSLAHPVRANWINPDADPTPLVQWALAEVRGELAVRPGE